MEKREIKFRAYDKQEKKMIDADSWYFSETFQPFVSSVEECVNAGFAIMQFTGLKDKNEKEIYEGDIIQCYYSGDKHGAIERVEFKDGAFILRHRAIPISVYLEYIESDPYSTELEIIGNIYEKYELLNSNII